MDKSEKLVAGCFAFETAPFGIHPLDNQRAKEYRATLVKEGKSWPEAEIQIRNYLNSKAKSPVFIDDQLAKAKRFLEPTLNKSRK